MELGRGLKLEGHGLNLHLLMGFEALLRDSDTQTQLTKPETVGLTGA